MPPLRIPIDGLWRCLCPSIDTIAPSYYSARHSASRLPTIRLSSDKRRSTLLSSRAFTSSSQRRWRASTSNIPSRNDRVSTSSPGTKPPRLDDELLPQDNRVPSGDALKIRQLSIRPPFRRRRNSDLPHVPPLEATPVNTLYERLRNLLGEEGKYEEIVELVEHLILVRGEKPSLLHYDALITANSDAEHGSVVTVKALLDEMREEGINGNSGLYHNVLRVLAIHPDYVLRNEVMQEMKERWLGLSPEGWHSLVAGLLRDRQYEMAVDKLEQMQADQISIQPWLYDILMYRLCEAGELDQVFQLLAHRFDTDRFHISPRLWYYLLDTFSRAFHYEGTKYIWRLRVSTEFLNPSDGVCGNVLNLAARYADPGLATSATRILSARRSALTVLHYEALLGAYAGSGDFNTASRVFGVMSTAGFEPDSSTTRPLLDYLAIYPNRPSEAWVVLKSQFSNGHTIHIAVINVIIEAYITFNRYKEAVEVYKELHTICETGPNTETFDLLMQGAERNEAKDTAMFLASEMVALGITPGHLTYDRLIMVCMHQDDYEDAFSYLNEMTEVGKDRFDDHGKKGWWLRKGTMASLIKRCAKSHDDRGKQILEEAVGRGVVNETWADTFFFELHGKKRPRKQKRTEEVDKADKNERAGLGFAAWSTRY